MSWLEAILSLFVIIDPIGNIPTFLGVTAGIEKEKRQRAFTVSVMVAAGILLLFSFTGDVILRRVFQIEIAHLQIAGGILLIVMAIDDLVFGSQRRPKTAEETLSAEEVGCVPLGCPLLAGPGAIVTTHCCRAGLVSRRDVLRRGYQPALRPISHHGHLQSHAGLPGRHRRTDAYCRPWRILSNHKIKGIRPGGLY
jgi:MarC family membrane protein